MKRPRALFISILWIFLFFGIRAAISVAASLSTVGESLIENITNAASANASNILFLCNIITPVLALLSFKLCGNKFMISVGFKKLGITGLLVSITMATVCAPVLNYLIGLIPFPDVVYDIYAKTSVVAFFKNSELSVITAALLMPLCEEIIFRGAVLHALNSAFSTFSSVFLTTVFYVLIYPTPEKAVFALITGLLFSLMCLRFDSLFSPLIAHIVFALVSEYFSLDVFKNGTQYGVLALCAAAVLSLAIWMTSTAIKNRRA